MSVGLNIISAQIQVVVIYLEIGLYLLVVY